MPIVIVGNKLDLCESVDGDSLQENQRQVSYEQGKTFATANHMSYFETSAKDGRGVQELMDNIMEQAFQIALTKL